MGVKMDFINKNKGIFASALSGVLVTILVASGLSEECGTQLVNLIPLF